ncbi:hypothetical protein AGOR_G00183290 [Albula goreensis]|uniref:Uncharacterized protein n=1 Tax=Albula goreensis TaxID=1534307 RepID=A0A8T3CX14_9TELE|nr:hypothetical protein AGOR_G00183290 [Albula goreensis]
MCALSVGSVFLLPATLKPTGEFIQTQLAAMELAAEPTEEMRIIVHEGSSVHLEVFHTENEVLRRKLKQMESRPISMQTAGENTGQESSGRPPCSDGILVGELEVFESINRDQGAAQSRPAEPR